MTSILMVMIGCALVALCIYSIRLQWSVGPIALAVAVICAGLAYDAFVIGFGQTIGAGDTLEALNTGRYWVHAILTPLLILIVGNLVSRLGVEQARTRNVILGGIALVAMLILLGVAGEAAKLHLVPEEDGGSLRYVNGAASGLPLPAVITALAMVVLGMMAWRYGGGVWWLFLGAMLMLLLTAAGVAAYWLANLGEVFLMLGVVLTMRVVGEREMAATIAAGEES